MTNEQAYKILNDAPEGAEYFHKSYYKVTDGIIYLWVGCYEFWYSLENKAEFVSDKLTEEKSLKGIRDEIVGKEKQLNERMIYAVRYLKGVYQPVSYQNEMPSLLLVVVGSCRGFLLNIGEIVKGYSGFDSNFLSLICTSIKYNDFIDELSSAEWMTDGPHCYEAYRQAYLDMRESGYV